MPGTFRLNVDVAGLVSESLLVDVAIGATVDVGDVALRLVDDAASQGHLTGVAELGGAAADGHAGIAIRLDGTPYSTTTDASGAFGLAVPAGLYDLTFSAPGYGSASLADLRVADGGATTELPDKIILVAQPGAVRGTLALAGASDPGAIVGMADVSLFREGEDQPTQIVQPEASGRFALVDVGAGEWRLSVVLDTFAPVSVEFSVGPGEGVDLRQIVLLPAPEGVVTGIAHLEGAPPDGHRGIVVTDLATRRLTLTLANGSFRLALPAGRHELSLSHDDYDDPPVVPVTVVAGETMSLPASVTLPARPGSIMGVVAAVGLAGPDAEEQLPAADISLSRAGDAMPRITHPDARGRFSFDAVPIGQWQIDISLARFDPQSVEVTVRPAEAVDLRRLTLSSAPDGFVHGQALLAGAPLDGMADIRVDTSIGDRSTTTDPQGFFLIALPAGRHDLRFSRRGYASAEAPDIDVQANRTTELPPDSVVLAPRPGGLRGLVRLPAGYEDPDRMQRVALSLFPAGLANNEAPPTQVLNPGTDGTFLFDAVTPGAWRVEANLDEADFEGDSAVRDVAPGEVTHLDVLQMHLRALEAGEQPTAIVGTARLAGVVDPQAHGGILISVLTTPLVALTGSDGRFQVSGVPSGIPLTLSFRRDGYGSVSLVIPRVDREETVALEDPTLLPALPGEIRGQVALDRHGSPETLATVSVSLRDLAGALVDAATLDPLGAFALRDVAAGEYRLATSLSGYTADNRPVTVRLGAQTDVGSILLRHESGTGDAVVLGGTVQLPEGDDHSGTQVRVRFANRDAPFDSTITDAAGRFALLASRQDRYTIEIEHPGFGLPGALGPYAYDAAARAFRDEQGRAIDLRMDRAPLDGRITVAFSMTPAWIPGPQQLADVRILGPNTSTGLDDLDAGVRHVFGGLSAGTYVVRVQRPGFETFETLATLDLGHTEVVLDQITLPLRDLSASGIDVDDQTLTPADLDDSVNLVGADLAGATLDGDFSERDLRGANLANADLHLATLIGAHLEQAVLFGANLAGTDLTGAHLDYATLFGADLAGATLIGAHLTGVNFTNAQLTDATFVDRAIRDDQLPAPPCAVGAVRPAVELKQAIFAGAHLGGAFLPGVDLTGADFGGARLPGTVLRRACLHEARFTLTDISGADFDQADLTGANLVNAVMQRTSLRGADLTGANLLSAIIELADLSCLRRTVDGFCACDEAFADTDPGGACLGAVPAATWRTSCGCRTRLADSNLNGANLVGAQFVGADLARASLVGVSIGDAASAPALQPADCVLPDDCVFEPGAACVAAAGRVCTVSQTRFAEARLDAAEFAGVGLNHADFTGISAVGANFSNARFFPNSTYSHARFDGANLTGADLSNVDLRGVAFDGATLVGTQLVNADLRGVSLEDTRLENVNLTNARARGVDMSRAVIRGAFDPLAVAELRDPSLNLSEGDFEMDGVDLVGQDVTWLSRAHGARLDHADLRNAYLSSNVTLQRLSLRGADLRSGPGLGGPFAPYRLFQCDLSGADFSQTPFDVGDQVRALRISASRARGTNFSETDLRMSRSASFIADSDLTGARFDGMHGGEGIINGYFFRKSDLRNAHLNGMRGALTVSDCMADGLDLGGADLDGLWLDRTDLDTAVGVPVAIRSFQATKSSLRGLDLRAVDLSGDLSLSRADARGTEFPPVRAAGRDTCRFERVRMAGASLAGADLTGCSFFNTDLADVALGNANLTGASGQCIGVINPANHVGAVNAPPGNTHVPGVCFEDQRGSGMTLLGPFPSFERYDGRGGFFTNDFSFDRGNLAQANFNDARLDGARIVARPYPGELYDGTLNDASFAGASLAGATIEVGNTQSGVSFRGADLRYAVLDRYSWASGAPIFAGRMQLASADFSDALWGGDTLIDSCILCRAHGTGAAIIGRIGALQRLDARGAQLRGADLSGRVVDASDLSGGDLTDSVWANGALLRGTRLDRALLTRADFRSANLSTFESVGASLADADAEDANFAGAALVQANLTCANLRGANLQGATLDSAYALGCLDLTDANLTQAALLGFSLKHATLDGTNLTRTHLIGRDFADTSLSGASLSIADATDALFLRADLSGVDFSSAVVANAQFDDATGSRANFRDADARDARFAYADLTGALFTGADLRRADFWHADLAGGDLRGADLRHATFSRANLEGAHLCRSQIPTLRAGALGTPLIDEGC